MSVVCPDGHRTESSDYCDVCGLPVAGTLLGGGSAPAGPFPGGSPSSPPPSSSPAPAALKPCPNCGFEALSGALFCEDCGYDFTTGALPPPLPGGQASVQLPPDAPTQGQPAPAAAATQVVTEAPGNGLGPSSGAPTWVSEVWVDPDWYATQDSNDPCPSPGMPVVVPLDARSLLVGRRSVSRNITPQIDCGSDSGVSRRHAQLTTDGQRWWIEDLQSSNGTYVGQAGAPLPTMPLPAGQKQEFTPNDRIYLGAWTRIVVRRATPDEF